MSFYHRLVPAFTPRPGPSLIHGDLRVRREDWPARVARAAGWLRAQGVKPGDRVAIQGPKSAPFVDLLLAGLAIGAPVIPLNDRYTAVEVAGILADARPRLAILLHPSDTAVAWADAVQAIDHAVPESLIAQPDGAAPAIVLYTSGTTGRPKGAVTSHDALWAGVDSLQVAWGWTEDDVLLHALPLFHVHGLFVALFGALRAGATCRVVDRFDPAETLDQLVEDRCTVFMGVPTFYQRFLALPPGRRWDLSKMRLFTSGSAGLPAPTWEAFDARFGHRIVERYGMTEVGIVVSNALGDRRPGTIGRPLPGVSARVVDPDAGAPRPDGEVGELQIRAPSAFTGYLGQPERTEEMFTPDGWVRTGDLAQRAPDGWLTLVGRARDLVIVGGFNVHPAEVESALLEHPDVAEAAVVGLPDADLGERVVASVVGARPVDEATLMRFLAERLAPYKRPRAIRILSDLPRNAMGKLQKDAVRAAWERPAVRSAHPGEAAWLADNNVSLALETEGLALDGDTARRGAERVFRGDVGARYLVAEIGGEPVGQCLITTEWSDWRDAAVWWIHSVYVRPSARRRGVWRALHAEVGALARAAGAPVVRLYVDRTNEAAIAVYRASGMDGDHYLVFEQAP